MNAPSNTLAPARWAAWGKRLLAALLALCGACPGVAPAQEYLIDTWRFDDDLPRDGIISIAQGGDGYLWVSSRYGVARFDGVRFVNFTTQTGAQFLGYHYANLVTDGTGAVSFGTPGGGLLEWQSGQLRTWGAAGKPVFGPVTAGFTNAQGLPLVVAPDGRVVTYSNGVSQTVVDTSRWGGPVAPSICQDRQGRMWFVTYQHKLVRVAGTNAQELVYGSGESERHWIMLQADAAGDVWAGTQFEVGRWRGDSFEPIPGPLESFPVDDLLVAPGPGSDTPAASEGAAQERGGRLWVVALGRAWLLEGSRWQTNVWFEPSAGRYETGARLADKAGNLWFTATTASIARAGADGSLLLWTGNDGLPPGRVAAFCEDREGSLWVGIEHAGLARLRERCFLPLGMREGTRAPLVWAVVEDDAGAIWLGTEKSGLQRWQQGRLTQFNLGNNGLPGSVHSLCVSRQGTLWAGTGETGVFRFEDGKFVPVWEHPQPGWDKRVYTIYEDHLGRMWFGTGLGLYRLANGQVTQCAARGFEMGGVRALAEDGTGRLWVGLSGGEARLAWVEGDSVVARPSPAELSAHDIFGLTADPDGAMWLGTVGGGLWRWRQGTFTHYTKAEGLPDDRIYAINFDSARNLWLASPAGIFRLRRPELAAFDAQTAGSLNCLAFDRTDGLPTRECAGGSQPSTYRARDGRLLFALVEGAVALDPDRVRVNRLPPNVLIEEVRVDGKPVEFHAQAPLPDALPGRLLSLGPGRHVVQFRFTATSLLAGSKVRFRCRLEGVDKEWRDGDASRSELYSLTAPGSYRFRVLACNNDGVWNQTGTALTLWVKPYLWQNWWFRAGSMVAVLLGTGGAIRYFERRSLQRKLEQLERQQMLETERARIARDIHDELGASLTEIGLLSEFAQREATPPEQVKADVQRIAAKAQSSTRALDEIVWAVNPRNDTLDAFVSYACAYAEEQLRLAQLRCRLDIASPLPSRPLRAEVRHHLFLAFKEALNNVVNHAQASQVDVAVSFEEGQLRILVADNGRGFVYDGDHQPGSRGNGLVNMQARLESIGGRFECRSGRGQGTRITLIAAVV